MSTMHSAGAPSVGYHKPGDDGRIPVERGGPGHGETLRRMTLITLGAGVVLTTFLAVAGIVFGDLGEGLGKAIASSMALFAYGLLTLIGGVYRYEHRPSTTLANASVITAIFGLFLGVIAIWTDFSLTAYKFAWVGFIVAFATAHASLLQARRQSGDSQFVRGLLTATNLFIAFAAFMLSVFVLAIEDVGRGFITAVASILLIDLMLNVLVPIARSVRPSSTQRPEAALETDRMSDSSADADYGI